MSQQEDEAVRTIGTGPAVLLVHGGGGPQSMQPLAEGLSVDHEVLLPTLPGWAGQPRDPAVRTVPDLARRCVELLVAAGLSDVTVVASSFGGWVAAELALLAPRGLIGRVILLNPVGPTPSPSELARSNPPRTPAGGEDPLDLVRSYTGPAMSSPDLSERLGAIEQPTVVLWGADDPVLPPAYGQRVASDLGNGTYVVIPGAGHLPHADAPERTLAVIRDFLDSTRVVTR